MNIIILEGHFLVLAVPGIKYTIQACSLFLATKLLLLPHFVALYLSPRPPVSLKHTHWCTLSPTKASDTWRKQAVTCACVSLGKAFEGGISGLFLRHSDKADSVFLCVFHFLPSPVPFLHMYYPFTHPSAFLLSDTFTHTRDLTLTLCHIHTKLGHPFSDAIAYTSEDSLK